MVEQSACTVNILATVAKGGEGAFCCVCAPLLPITFGGEKEEEEEGEEEEGEEGEGKDREG